MRTALVLLILMCSATALHAATMTITIPGSPGDPTSLAAQVIEAFAERYKCVSHATDVPGTPQDDTIGCVKARDADGVPTTTVTKATFAQEIIRRFIREVYKANQRVLAADVAGQAAGTQADIDSAPVDVQ